MVLDSLRALRHDADTPFTGRGVMGPCAWGGGEGHATWRSCEDASCAGRSDATEGRPRTRPLGGARLLGGPPPHLDALRARRGCCVGGSRGSPEGPALAPCALATSCACCCAVSIFGAQSSVQCTVRREGPRGGDMRRRQGSDRSGPRGAPWACIVAVTWARRIVAHALSGAPAGAAVVGSAGGWVVSAPLGAPRRRACGSDRASAAAGCVAARPNGLACSATGGYSLPLPPLGSACVVRLTPLCVLRGRPRRGVPERAAPTATAPSTAARRGAPAGRFALGLCRAPRPGSVCAPLPCPWEACPAAASCAPPESRHGSRHGSRDPHRRSARRFESCIVGRRAGLHGKGRGGSRSPHVRASGMFPWPQTL